MEFERKDVYIIIHERDLVNLIRQIRNIKMQLGKDICIISYNEIPLKELLGITVISTNFVALRECAA